MSQQTAMMWRELQNCSRDQMFYVMELEHIFPHLPSDAVCVQWIRGGKRDISPSLAKNDEEFYCHIIINDDEKRAMVIAVLENHLRNYPSSEIEGYVVGRSSIAVIPRLEDGSTIGKNIVTCDG